MWILVNNIPVNVFDDFYASTVIEFNKEFVSENICFYKEDYGSGRSITRIILRIAASKKWMDVECMETELIERKSHNGYKYHDTKYIQKYEDFKRVENEIMENPLDSLCNFDQDTLKTNLEIAGFMIPEVKVQEVKF